MYIHVLGSYHDNNTCNENINVKLCTYISVILQYSIVQYSIVQYSMHLPVHVHVHVQYIHMYLTYMYTCYRIIIYPYHHILVYCSIPVPIYSNTRVHVYCFNLHYISFDLQLKSPLHCLIYGGVLFPNKLGLANIQYLFHVNLHHKVRKY